MNVPIRYVILLHRLPRWLVSREREREKAYVYTKGDLIYIHVHVQLYKQTHIIQTTYCSSTDPQRTFCDWLHPVPTLS